MNKTVWVPVALLAVVGFGFAGCATSGNQQVHNAGNGAVLGGLLGAGLGAIMGHQSGHTAEGAAIGGALGAGGGYVIGNEQDKERLHQETVEGVQSATAVANTVVINVKNSNGSITPVTLHRNGNVYVGPKGEQYTQLPTEDQLRSVYGF